MADFPPEIKEQIASFCTLSSALSLAVTHSTYLEASERRIYHSLTILADAQSVQALTALSRKRARYSFVKSLTMEIFDNNDEANVKVGRMVVEVLHSLVNLEELRIRLGPCAYGRNARDVEGAVVFLRDLDRVFSSKDMPQLKTLFCNDSFDLADILKSQRRLENLVFRSSTNVIVDQAAVVETLERLRDAGEMPQTLRAVYGVHEPVCDGQFATGAIQRGPTPNWNIVLLPIFFPDLDNLFERLAALLGTEKPCKGRMCLDSVGIAQVFCRDLSQIDELLRKLGNSFRSVVHLGIVTEGPDPTTDDIGTALQSLPNLKSLLFCTRREAGEYDTEEDYNPDHDPRLAGGTEVLRRRAEKWGTICPQLNAVAFSLNYGWHCRDASGRWLRTGK